MRYVFELGKISELPQVYEIIDQRIRWMNEVGIRQWNVTDYWECYPKEYYKKNVCEGRLYVLKRETDSRVVAAAVIYEKDARWGADDAPAYYVHHLATALGEKGAGTVMLDALFWLAGEHEKKYLRLDCAIDSEKLNEYYEQQGFIFAGTCVDGKYTGNLREKLVLFTV